VPSHEEAGSLSSSQTAQDAMILRTWGAAVLRPYNAWACRHVASAAKVENAGGMPFEAQGKAGATALVGGGGLGFGGLVVEFQD
jgi:hypothetical protein